ncbi:MAG: saccharopine dehydrogenase [Paracoccaceae bacterium]
MTHLWVRAEPRENEDRVGLMPLGAVELIKAGFRITVERSDARVIPIEDYADVGCEIADEGSWPEAPDGAIIFGLKELPEDGTPLKHRHIMFGHAFKGQPSGPAFLKRFLAGNGALYDLEYLVDESGRRVAAFGYWAGFAGAAITLKGWAAQQVDDTVESLMPYESAEAMEDDVRADLNAAFAPRPRALVIGALGRVGAGACDLCEAVGVEVTRWDMAETAHGGPFPEVLAHDILLNCILAQPGAPVFVPMDAIEAGRALRMIGDIACDPASEYSPIKVYDAVTDWDEPVLTVAENPPLGVMAIDNLPSLLPAEASADFAAQLLPSLLALGEIKAGVWGRARAVFDREIAAL